MYSLEGKVFKFGDDINTDEIIPAKYLVTTDAEKLGKHCMVGVKEDFPELVNKGDIIVAGENFGCGSSREHAPISIKGCGVSCVIAKSFARIFYRNSINIGLPIIEYKQIDNISSGDELKVDLRKGIVNNLTTGDEFEVSNFPEFIQQIISSGGLLEWIKSHE